MARVALNDLLDGLQGKLGNALVFKNIRGKTFVSLPARKPNKKKETDAQKQTRDNFRNATLWAQSLMMDPEKKAYYRKRAKELKLPNAYTAAITDYMRKVKVSKNEGRGSVTYTVSKPGFSIKDVKAISSNTNESINHHTTRKGNGSWILTFKQESDISSLVLTITDNFNRVTVIHTNSILISSGQLTKT